MLTIRRWQRLRKIIEDARFRLLEKNREFGIVLMYFRFVAHTGIKKISTDGSTIYFSPSYLEKLREEELEYLLCHQVMHAALGHTETSERELITEYHLACDVFLNDKFSKGGYRLEGFSHLGKLPTRLPWKNHEIGDLTEAEIQRLPEMGMLYFLPEQSRQEYFPDSVEFWQGNYISGEATIIIDFPNLETETAPTVPEREGENGGMKKFGGSRPTEAKNSTLFRKINVTSVLRLAGNSNPLMKLVVNARKKATLDWKRLLIDFVQREVCDYSFTPPDKRYTESPFFLPDYNQEEKRVENIIFFVDTSGSISQEDLTAAYSEFCGIFEQFNGKITGELAFFDSEVHPSCKIGVGRGLPKFEPTGGGGTDFDILFEYVNEAHPFSPPSGIVVFTDGFADYPEESAAKGVPVLWLINNEEALPPWGKVARYPS